MSKKDVENIISNNPDDHLDNCMSNDDHGDVETHTGLSHVYYVNTNTEKKKFVNKNKKKAHEKKVALKLKKTTTKKVSTPTKDKWTVKKKEISRKKKKGVEATKKSVGKKKSNPKRKFAHTMKIVKDGVEDNLVNIVVSHVKKNRKIIGGKKIPTNIHVTLMDKVSFHSKEGVLKWKYVYHKRIAPERGAV